MNAKHVLKAATLIGLLVMGVGCDNPAKSPPGNPLPTSAAVPNAPWLGIPSAVNQVIVALHDGTGWLLNKSEVSVKKSGEVYASTNSGTMVADYQIKVQFGGESFETTAKEVPCDKDGIPTEASIDRLRTAVEDIKAKMKRLQK
jgi:hypothetical protein